MRARALNQRSCAGLSVGEFLKLAARLDCVGVELRNDLGRSLFDGLSPEVARANAQDAGLRILGLSEVYGFNVWSKEREAEIIALRDNALAVGAETVSLIPCVDGRAVLPLRDALREVLGIFEGSGVVPLVEPIGFAASSVRTKEPLVDAIEAVADARRIKLVHDTFQHAICGETRLFPEHTGLVHISGVSDDRVVLDEVQDQHRRLVDAQDRCGNLVQIESLLAAGYQGAFSFETTDTAFIETCSEQDIRTSFEFIERCVG